MDRRRFLQLAAAGSGVAATRALPFARAATASALAPVPFQYGVASGDPLPDGVIIWTRVTPDASATPGSGNGTAGIRGMGSRQRSRLHEHRGHRLSDLERGLRPHDQGRCRRPLAVHAHWYRFHALGATSAMAGRSRARTARPQSFGPFRHGVLLEFRGGILHALPNARRPQRPRLRRPPWRLHLRVRDARYGPGPAIGRPNDPAHELLSLSDYRRRYACYKGDPDLRALHAAHPFVLTLDDHEVADNRWRNGAGQPQPRRGQLGRRVTNGYRAWYDWLPVRHPTRVTRSACTAVCSSAP